MKRTITDDEVDFQYDIMHDKAVALCKAALGHMGFYHVESCEVEGRIDFVFRNLYNNTNWEVSLERADFEK